MPLTVNDMRIIIKLLENRLRADYDPDCDNLLSRMKERLKRAESAPVSQQKQWRD